MSQDERIRAQAHAQARENLDRLDELARRIETLVLLIKEEHISKLIELNEEINKTERDFCDAYIASYD